MFIYTAQNRPSGKIQNQPTISLVKELKSTLSMILDHRQETRTSCSGSNHVMNQLKLNTNQLIILDTNNACLNASWCQTPRGMSVALEKVQITVFIRTGLFSGSDWLEIANYLLYQCLKQKQYQLQFLKKSWKSVEKQVSYRLQNWMKF